MESLKENQIQKRKPKSKGQKTISWQIESLKKPNSKAKPLYFEKLANHLGSLLNLPAAYRLPWLNQLFHNIFHY